MPSDGLFTLFRLKDNTATPRSIIWSADYILSDPAAPLTQTASGADIIYISTKNAGTTKLVQFTNNYGAPGS